MVAESDTNYGRANAEFAYRSACLRLNLKANRLAACLKAGFRSDQPRVPAGNPDGGQWTRVPGWARGEASASGGRSDIAEPFRNLVVPIGGRGRRVRGGQVRVGSRWLPATPAQQARMQVTNNARRNAIAEVRKIDPNWKPRPQLFESVEGLIRANEAQRLEAELRILELTGRMPRLGPFFREWVSSPPPGKRLDSRGQRKLDQLGKNTAAMAAAQRTT